MSKAPKIQKTLSHRVTILEKRIALLIKRVEKMESTVEKSRLSQIVFGAPLSNEVKLPNYMCIFSKCETPVACGDIGNCVKRRQQNCRHTWSHRTDGKVSSCRGCGLVRHND